MSVRILPLLVLLVVFALCSGAAITAAEPTSRLVHVSGKGVVKAAPDQVFVQITLTTIDDDLSRVRDNSDKEARAILDLARKQGTDEKGFQVSRLALSLSYNEQLRRQIYTVERHVTVQLNDLTKLDALLADLLRERNLKVVGISYGTSTAREHEFEARSRAVADAAEKAKHLAVLNGLKLGKAREIRVASESQSPFVISVLPVVGSADQTSPRRRADNRGRSTNEVVANAAHSDAPEYFIAFQPPAQGPKKREDAKLAGKPFALGMIEITAQVEVDFELAE